MSITSASPVTLDVADAARQDEILGRTIATMATLGQLRRGINGGVYIHIPHVTRYGIGLGKYTVGLYAPTVDDYPIMTVAGNSPTGAVIEVTQLDGHRLANAIKRAIAFAYSEDVAQSKGE